MPKIAVFGITGRMGQCLVRALREPPPVGESPAERSELSGALASAASRHLGQDAALEGPATGVRITADARVALGDAVVAIDFSLPQGIAEHAQACLERRVALLVGTTGFDAATRRELEGAARAIPLLIAPNTSPGVAVMGHLIEVAARGSREASASPRSAPGTSSASTRRCWPRTASASSSRIGPPTGWCSRAAHFSPRRGWRVVRPDFTA